jgi:hypothetical protein
VFKTEAIILSVESIRDSNIRIVALSKEFWKISCWYKKKVFPHDIWDIILISLERDNGINAIKYIEPRSCPREEHWTYKKIVIFLESLSMMYTLLPEESPYQSLFHDYRWLLVHMDSCHTLHEHHYLLFQFRLLRTLWYIGKDDMSKTPVLRYIFENILTTPLSQLLWSRELHRDDAETLETKNREALYRSTL